MTGEGVPTPEKDSPWEMVYRGSLFCVEKHKSKGFERAVRPPGVRLLLTNTDGHILLTCEFRNELQTTDMRLPGGKVFDDLESFLHARHSPQSMDEAVKRAARLEAKQEAGVDRIDSLTLHHASPLGASVEWTLYYMTGMIVAQSEQELEEDERLRGIAVHFYTPQEVRTLLDTGAIQEDRSAHVLSHYIRSRFGV